MIVLRWRIEFRMGDKVLLSWVERRLRGNIFFCFRKKEISVESMGLMCESW